MSASGDITTLLHRSSAGDRSAFDALFAALYAELHDLAERHRQGWNGSFTLNSTALVHEAYLKLVGQNGAAWNDRSHFLAVASRAIRHVLINYAERKKAAKRGGGVADVDLEEANPLTEEAADEVLALHEALERLADVNERQARVVEARFFGGSTIEETARLVGASPATVKRDWLMASAWLHQELRRPDE